jgi:NAD(P)-dependent dehydrogenase (short-subunit alcohol dehydrogenase family)
MTGRFAGKVAVVAGCARPPGIGYATALRLARGGASVACVDAVGTMPPEWGPSAYDTGFVSHELLEEVTAEVAAAGPATATALPTRSTRPRGRQPRPWRLRGSGRLTSAAA